VCGPTAISAHDKERIAAFHARVGSVTRSPFGSDDEIGMLNLIDPESTRRIMSEVDGSRIYDLSVDYFVGMPSWTIFGDPPYQIWMTHTPHGTVIDDASGVGRTQNELVGYSGDAVSMYTHCGTHIDTLNHFGYHGHVWNGFNADEHLGSRHWTVAGADKHPPVVARGVLVDVAASVGVDVLPDSFAIGEEELRNALRKQDTELRVGDVVMLRTGRARVWPDLRYVVNEPGLNRAGAEFLAKSGAIMIGADNIGLEQAPSADPDNWDCVHTYLLAEAGVPIIEVLDLERLSEDRVYQFAVVGACLRLRGATGSPMRPLAMALRS
jgi:kynurenine formamidase